MAKLLSFKKKRWERGQGIVILQIVEVKMRYFLQLSYSGKNYFGWQKQPNQSSVQEVLEKCLSTYLRQEIAVVGAGRTDTGVHAKEYFAHFDSKSISNFNDFVFRMNAFLPKDIAIQNIFQVRSEAHARFDAAERTYNYYVTIGKNPFNQDFSYQIHHFPDIDKMNEACAYLLGQKDFECFSRSGSDVKTFICDIKEAFWTKDENQLIFTITADRFLRNMVRAIVGTLLEIGLEKRPVSEMEKIIESKNRSKAGPSAPPQGLFLSKVNYPSDLFEDNEFVERKEQK